MIPSYLVAALGELERGVREIPGPASHDRIAMYLATVGMAGDDEIAWCSGFANWSLIEGGYVGTNKPNARSWLAWGREVLTPTFGAITVLRRGTQAWQGHVGFLLDVTHSGILLLGGNQSDRVGVAPFALSDLLGYRLPPLTVEV